MKKRTVLFVTAGHAKPAHTATGHPVVQRCAEVEKERKRAGRTDYPGLASCCHRQPSMALTVACANLAQTCRGACLLGSCLMPSGYFVICIYTINGYGRETCAICPTYVRTKLDEKNHFVQPAIMRWYGLSGTADGAHQDVATDVVGRFTHLHGNIKMCTRRQYFDSLSQLANIDAFTRLFQRLKRQSRCLPSQKGLPYTAPGARTCPVWRTEI